jgi:hypothetical protein
MALVFDFQQTNPWGQTVDAQRSDLWSVDFSAAMTGLNNSTGLGAPTGTAPTLPPKLGTYFAQTVTLSELKLRAEPIRRDSRPYQMPSWDEPIEAITMTFLLDCYGQLGAVRDPYASDIYQMLEAWRARVRMGRGGMSSEFSLDLDSSYGFLTPFRWDVRVNLLRGAVPSVSIAEISNDLIATLQLRLVNAWPASYRISELSYDAPKPVTLSTTFYAEDIQQLPVS